MTEVIRLTDTAAFADLGRYAARARAVDAEGAIRLQCAGGVLAAWVGVLPGSGILGEGTVLGLRTFALADPADLDVVVPLAAVTDRTARAGTDLPVPPVRALAPWAAVTPPRVGWRAVGTVAADVLAAAARDGIARPYAAGDKLKLAPGESVTLMPGDWHAFWGEGGDVLIGEVSTVNDDETDNIFREPIGRFAEIEKVRLARLARAWLEMERETRGDDFTVVAVEDKRDLQPLDEVRAGIERLLDERDPIVIRLSLVTQTITTQSDL